MTAEIIGPVAGEATLALRPQHCLQSADEPLQFWKFVRAQRWRHVADQARDVAIAVISRPCRGTNMGGAQARHV